MTYLFERLVVDETRSILGDLELPFLDLLAELPTRAAADQRVKSDIACRKLEEISEDVHNAVLAPAKPSRAESEWEELRGE